MLSSATYDFYPHIDIAINLLFPNIFENVLHLSIVVMITDP